MKGLRLFLLTPVSLCLVLLGYPSGIVHASDASDILYGVADIVRAFHFEDRYYDDYGAYRQGQVDQYNSMREQMLARERMASQSERLRLERERMAWEQRENARLHDEHGLRSQWEHDRTQYKQHSHEPQHPGSQHREPQRMEQRHEPQHQGVQHQEPQHMEQEHRGQQHQAPQQVQQHQGQHQEQGIHEQQHSGRQDRRE